MLQLERFKSVNAVAPKPGVSDKYQFVSTTECLKTFQDKGWIPVSVSEKRANKVENYGFQKHLIRLRKNDTLRSGGFNNEVIPEIVLINSHDTGAAFHIMAGMFRMVCANGLIVADNLFGSQRVVHVGYAKEKVECAIDVVEKQFSIIAERIKEYQNILVNSYDETNFATEACLLRWKEGKAPNPSALLATHRVEDKTPTLWNLFNKVQENMLRGMSRRQVAYATGGWSRNSHAIRGTQNIDLTVKINKELWSMTEAFARNKMEPVTV